MYLLQFRRYPTSLSWTPCFLFLHNWYKTANLAKINSGPVQQPVKTFQNVEDKTSSKSEVFRRILLPNTQFKASLQEYCNKNTPDESTINKDVNAE